jgi:hypothetical protein
MCKENGGQRRVSLGGLVIKLQRALGCTAGAFIVIEGSPWCLKGMDHYHEICNGYRLAITNPM